MKNVKILTIVLAIILIIMIGFFGIYTQKQNRMENQVKQYSYAMDLDATRTIRLVVSEESEKIIKDAEGKKVENSEDLTDEEIQEKGYTQEQVPYNSDEIKTLENYKKTTEILENRLKQIGIDNYILKLNEETGEIILETTENNRIESVLNVVNTIGKFEIVDNDTNEVLMNNQHIKSASITSQQTTTGTTIYLQLELNQEGISKLEEIKNSTKTSDETGEEVEDESDNEVESAETEETENVTNSTKDESKEEENTEKIGKATLDDQEIDEVSFDDQQNPNRIRIAIGNATTSTETLNQNANEASYVAFMINTGKLPITYEMDENQYIMSEITNDELQIALYIIIGLIIIGMIVLIIKYKLSGLLGVIAYIGFIASLLILIRYTNVILSTEGLLAILITLILNYVLLNKILKEPYSLEVYKKFFIKIIPIIILSITFCFVGWAPISSFGMVSFWGLVLMGVYNIIITSNLIKIKEGNEK